MEEHRSVGVTTMDLQSAAAELAAAFRRRKDGGGTASDAFFFMIGAGVSTPPVPLATQIEAECRRRLSGREDLARLAELAPTEAVDRYSYWLGHAYPQPMDREELFRSLIQRQPISEANFRLAHLLSSDEAPKLVVTTNFDDFLSRALTLFGTPHVVCDHPGTAERIDPERRGEVQLLHVHGTYWFYDCCNLRGEIESRAQDAVPHRTIASRLDGILFGRSPIVIGYSGWEQDVFMTALRHRLEAHPLRTNIYWFCHRRDDVANLPPFLRQCEYVRFVVPLASERGRRDALHADGDAGEGPPRADARTSAATGPETPRLDAVPVLDELIRALEMPAPRLTVNPIEFFATHLRTSLLPASPPHHGEQPADMYRLGPMIRRLEALSPTWTASAAADLDGNNELERMRDAIRRSQYREALDVALALSLDELDQAGLAEVRDTAYLAANSLRGSAEEAVAGFELVRRAAALFHSDDVEQTHENDRRTMLAIEAITETQGYDDALQLLDEALERYEGAPALESQFAELLERRAFILWEADRLDEALKAYEDIEQRYAQSDDPELGYAAGQAILEQAFILNQLDRYEDLLQLVDSYFEAYDDETGLHRVEPMMRYRVTALVQLERYEEAVAVTEEVQSMLGATAAPFLAPEWFEYQRGHCLERLGRLDEAAVAYAGVVADADASDWDAASAGLQLGKLLGRMGRRSEALEVLTTVIEHHADDPAFAELVDDAIEERDQLD